MAQAIGKETGKKRVDRVRKLLEEKKCDPFEGLIEIVQERNHAGKYVHGPEIRVPCLKELCSYLAPKLRSMEVSIDPEGGPLGFQIIQFGEMKDGKSIGIDTQHGLGSGHRPVLSSVHERGKQSGRESKPAEEDHHSTELRDSGSEPENSDNGRVDG